MLYYLVKAMVYDTREQRLAAIWAESYKKCSKLIEADFDYVPDLEGVSRFRKS